MSIISSIYALEILNTVQELMSILKVRLFSFVDLYLLLTVPCQSDGGDPGVHIRVSQSDDSQPIPPGGPIKVRWEILPRGGIVRHYRAALISAPKSPTKPSVFVRPEFLSHQGSDSVDDDDVENPGSASIFSASDWEYGLEPNLELDLDIDLASDSNWSIDSAVSASLSSSSINGGGTAQDKTAIGAAVRAQKVQTLARIRTRTRTGTKPKTRSGRTCSIKWPCSNGGVCTYRPVEAIMASISGRGTADAFPLLGVCRASLGL